MFPAPPTLAYNRPWKDGIDFAAWRAEGASLLVEANHKQLLNMVEHIRACVTFRDNTLFLPKKEALRKKRWEFVFEIPPVNYMAKLVICLKAA